MDIDSLIREGEGQRLEFKASFAEDDDAIRSLGAFANADGGSVLMGVSDDGDMNSIGSNSKAGS